MSYIRRISIIALTLSKVASCILLTSSLTVQAAQNNPWKVGYAAAGLIDELQVAWSDGLKKVVQDAGGTVIVVDSQNKIAKQVSDIEDLLTQKIDYLVINPVDEAGIVPAIEAANKAGVPVVTIDRAAAGGKVAVHVTFDNYKAGYDAGVYIAEQNNGKGDVAQLEGQAGTSVARERAQGFKDAIAKYPNMKIVFDKPTDWTTTQGQSATEDLLVAFPDVVGIWAHADSIIMGAVQAIEAAKPKQKIVTVGMGMFAGGPEAIKAHRLSASWELFPAELGKIAGQAVVDLHSGKQAGPVIKTPMVFVNADNIDKYLKK
jgi:ribose transport system substrate-binding protein